MLRYLARRLAASALILLGVSIVTFGLTFLIPADPVRMIAGRSASPQAVENIRHQLGLDQPVPVQYARYLGKLVQGDLGRSYVQKAEVSELIASRLPATLLLMAGAIFFELLIGLPAGILAATQRGKWLDRGVMIVSFAGVSAPQFVVGLLLLWRGGGSSGSSCCRSFAMGCSVSSLRISRGFAFARSGQLVVCLQLASENRTCFPDLTLCLRHSHRRSRRSTAAYAG